MSYLCLYCKKSFYTRTACRQHIESPFHYGDRHIQRTSRPAANDAAFTPALQPPRSTELGSSTQTLQVGYHPMSMCLEVGSAFTSIPFKILIGDETFYIHRKLLCSISEPLERLIHGSMREAQDGEVTIHDIDPQTFSRFCQWIYTGTYITVAKQDADFCDFGRKSSEIQSASRFPESKWFQDGHQDRRTAMATFAKLYKSHDLAPPALAHIEDCNSDGAAEVFLLHARLYVFAEKFEILRLKDLALQRLHEALLRSESVPEIVSDISSLIRYVYENTVEKTSHEEPLRVLICHYIRYQMDDMLEEPDFLQLAVESPEFLQDFFKQVHRRL